MLIPRKNDGQRQLVYAAAKRLCESNSNLDRPEGIVALSHIHDTGQTADGSNVQVVEAELAAGKRQDDGIGRSLLDKLCVIITSGFCSVATANQEEVLDRAASNSIDNRIRNAENCTVAEAGGNRRTAVDAGKLRILGKAAKLQSLFDHRCKVRW